MKVKNRLRKILSIKGLFAIALLSLFVQVFALATPSNAGSFPKFYKVSASGTPSNGGAVLGSGIYYLKGTDATLTAIPAVGYTFTGWTGDCSGSNPTYTIRNINSEKSCTATFKIPIIVVGTSLRIETQKVYDGNNTAAASTGMVMGIRTGDSVTVSTIATYDNKNVGTHKEISVHYVLGGLDASKYIIASDGFSIPCGVITPKPVSIVADPQSKIYGEADPILTYSGSLVAGDTFSGSVARTAGENVGTYAITQGTLSAGNNYTLTFIGANLTINKKDLNVFADSVTKVYGESDPVFTYTYDPLVNGDTESTVFSGSLGRISLGEGVGTYEITVNTLALSNNYNLVFNSNYLTITAAPISITINAQNKVYGTADPLVTYQITSGSLKGSDSLNITFNRAAGENIGKYEITGVSSNINYNATIAPEYLTITKAPVTIVASAKSKLVGAVDPALTDTITSGNFVGADTITGSLARQSGETAGKYVINQGTLSLSDNYELTFVGSTLTIATPAQAFVASTNNVATTATTDDATDDNNGTVLGEETSKTTTIKSDSKSAKASGFCSCKFLGIYCWIWLLILLIAAAAIWWFIVKRKKDQK